MSTITELGTDAGSGDDGVDYAALDAELDADDAAVPATRTDSERRSARRGLETIMIEATDEFLADPESMIGSVAEIRDNLLQAMTLELALENTARDKSEKHTLPKSLWPIQIAKILMHQHHILNLKLTGGNPLQSTIKLDDMPTLLGVYISEGAHEGVYVVSENYLKVLIQELSPTITGTALKDTMSIITNLAPTGEPSQRKNLVAVANGVFDTDTKTLLPHSPEMVFTSKSRVAYVENAPNPIITMPDGVEWNVEQWVNELSDDEGVPELLWEGLSALVRPNVSWNVGLFLYSELGNNGKGSYCALARNLLGDGAHTGIAIADFGKDFMLEALITAQAVIQDENNVGEFVDKLANFKAAITGDVIQVNVKHKPAIAVVFRGLVIQCVNDFFRTKDKSDSFGRRQLFIPFHKHFKGIERKYIKEDYLKRRDVLEYVLWRVLQMDHTELSVPKACADLQKQYQTNNDPILGFWDEFREDLVWELLPYPFLYDFYKEWMRQENPGGTIVSAMKFTQSMRSITQYDALWSPGDNAQIKHRVSNKMVLPEPLVLEYHLEAWTSTTYTGNDPAKKAVPDKLRDMYRGLVRK